MRLKIAMLDAQKEESSDLNKKSAVTHRRGISHNAQWDHLILSPGSLENRLVLLT